MELWPLRRELLKDLAVNFESLMFLNRLADTDA